ncbi:MAG: C40 family peptidase [Clostridiaceae bacterium]|nr:C40 family peptidase [Clostridiaceae bacterium]
MKNRFLELIRSKLGCGYVYGAQGEVMTKSLLNTLVNRFGRSHYYFDGYSAEKWVGKECYDCSGLIVWALQQLGLLTTDLTADGLYRICEPISRVALEPGDLVFYQNSNGYKNHVGVYIGNGRVIHARGTAYGVVETELFASFTAFGRLKVFPPKQEKPHWAEEPYTYLSQRIVIHEKRFNEPATRGEVFALLAQVVSLLDK